MNDSGFERYLPIKKMCVVLSTVLLSACTQKPVAASDLVISNVTLIGGNDFTVKKNSNIYIKDGLITKIDTTPITKGVLAIDGTGRYLIPGLFDCHVHTTDPEYDFARLMHFGVTSVFIPGGSTCSNSYFEKMRTLGSQDSLPAPRVFHTSQHFTMEGSHPVRTYSSSNWIEGKTVYFLRDTSQIKSLVKEVTKFPIQGIKLTIEEGPMPPPVPRMPQLFVNTVAEEARKNGTKVFVHVSDNVELAMAIEAEIRNILHFTGVDLDFDAEKELINSIYELDVSWVTTLMLDKSFLYPLHPEWIEDLNLKEIYSAKKIGDYTSAEAIMRAEDYIDFFRTDYELEDPSLKNIISFQVEDIKILYSNGVNMVLGTDTGNDYILHGHSLHEEMQLLELGGMEPKDIIKMGTHNAAKMLDVLDQLGTLEVGKKADMILLDQNPLESIKNTLSINTVIKNGVIQKRIEGNK